MLTRPERTTYMALPSSSSTKIFSPAAKRCSGNPARVSSEKSSQVSVMALTAASAHGIRFRLAPRPSIPQAKRPALDRRAQDDIHRDGIHQDGFHPPNRLRARRLMGSL